MARLCERCQYFTHGNDELTCPECRIPLRFTLLLQEPEPVPSFPPVAVSPARVAAPAPPALPTRQALTQRSTLVALDDFFIWCARHWLLLVAVPAVLAAVLGLAGYVTFGGVPLSERYAQIEVGMAEEQVIDILDSGSPLTSLTANFIEIPTSAANRYTWVWEEGGAKITLEITDARVVDKSADGLPEE